MKKVLLIGILVGLFFQFFTFGVNAQILINEFLPKPNPEWVEFLNQSSGEIDLGNYFFDDDADFNSDSGSSSKISLQGIMSAGSFCYWEMNSFLNDGGDVPTIFALNGDISDTYIYSSASAGLSYS